MLEKIQWKTTKFFGHHGSTVLTIIGAIGVVGTAALTANATTKAVELLKKAKEEKQGELTLKEKVKAAAPVYISPAIVGATTIACIFGSNKLNKNKQAALASACALINGSFNEYRNAAKSVYGDDADSKIQDEIAKLKCDRKAVVINHGATGLERLYRGEKILFYEKVSGRFFESSYERVMAAEYHLNRNFTRRSCANINEFYSLLGLPETEEGEKLGWNMASGIEWIDFDHRIVKMDDDTLDCCVIDYIFGPDGDYDEY